MLIGVGSVMVQVPKTRDRARASQCFRSDLLRPYLKKSDEVKREHGDMKRFLLDNLYKHPKVRAMTDQAQDMIATLFRRYMEQPGEMPAEFASPAKGGDELTRARVVAD